MITCYCSATSISAGINAVSDLEKLMRAIDAVVNFYDRRVSEANVDGLFGLRVLEGGKVTLVEM